MPKKDEVLNFTTEKKTINGFSFNKGARINLKYGKVPIIFGPFIVFFDDKKEIHLIEKSGMKLRCIEISKIKNIEINSTFFSGSEFYKYCWDELQKHWSK